MSLIEIPILAIIVPLASYRLTIILDQDISRLSHIPIKCLHHRRLLELFAELLVGDDELSILEYLN